MVVDADDLVGEIGFRGGIEDGRATAFDHEEIAPLLADADDTDEVRARWLVPAVRTMFADIVVADIDALEVALDLDDEPITLSVESGQLHAELGTARNPDVRIACDGPTAVAILRGQLHLDAATRQHRAQIKGTRTARARLARLVNAGATRRQSAPETS